ncbi:FkbM family methyltransferase [Roseovarius sp. 2305UL8-3]|uniref:FkbM family methyltransferase n=1 Tax=Roseovarius conchicola TaxID=3121636 RepID=UPI0035277734
MASLKKWLDRRRNPWRGAHYDAMKAWKRENAAARLYDYTALPSGGVVFDMGGFKGEWADMVLDQQPDAVIHLFEPHPRFADELRAKFDADERVTVYPVALGSADGEMLISDAGDASSSVADNGEGAPAEVIAVSRFFADRDIPRIDLMKVNIEGGEYDLLPALVSAGVIGRIDRLQVQFHLFEEALMAERDSIRAMLEKTHECVWCYPFVWEEWRLKT